MTAPPILKREWLHFPRIGGGDDEKYRQPPLPTRPAPTVDRTSQRRRQSQPPAPRQQPPPPPPQQQQITSTSSTMKYDRSRESVMAYMVPLPRPRMRHAGEPPVPQRYMLYMPPSPDLLKIPKDPKDGGNNNKERKRDKAVRLWQQEVKKAKTYNGELVSFRGMESASVRGAVWALNLIKPSDVTFLTRIPRKSIRSLNLVHPEAQEYDEVGGGGGKSREEGGGLTRSRTTRESPEELYHGVKEELNRSKKRTGRDFLIGTALLPVTTAVDLLIPVFGGFSEANLVWMVLNATGWTTANQITGRLVLADSNSTSQQEQQQQYEEDDIYTAGDDDHHRYQEGGHDRERGKERQEGDAAGAERSKKNDGPKIQMAFSECPAMGVMAAYVQAACHKCNPEAFPPPMYSPGEAEVLSNIGWTPERRGGQGVDEEDDIAWQIRQVTEDLRTSTDRAAKSWNRWCRRHMRSLHKTEEHNHREAKPSTNANAKAHANARAQASADRTPASRPSPPPRLPSIPSESYRMSVRYA